jgi:prevent-host-death family protein
MQYVWQLQEAKNRFSEVVDEAIQHGPQTVTRHGREAVVIVSYDDYIKLKPEPTNLLKALQVPEEYRIDLDINRSQDSARDIEL